MTDVTDATSDPKDRTIITLEELGVQLDELRSTEKWQSYLTMMARMPRYSANNLILIMFQRPDATLVQGYRAWQAAGRQVRKGEKGLRILAPSIRKDKDDPTKKRLTGFHTVSVFDIGQTDGDELPGDGWDAAPTTHVPGLYNELVLLAESEGVTVKLVEAHEGRPGALGWYDGQAKAISLRSERCDTLIHELAHHFDPELRKSSPPERELVAESAAWVVARRVGLDMDEAASKYLAGWGGGKKALLSVATRVTAVVKEFERVVIAIIDDPAEEAAA